jgi:hypothetical protein
MDFQNFHDAYRGVGQWILKLPHRQVVFRIRTTIVLTSVCSLAFLPRESPISPHHPKQSASTFLNVCFKSNINNLKFNQRVFLRYNPCFLP